MTLDLSVLKMGSKGAEVKSLQLLLNAKVNAGLKVDGDFGPATAAAVESFQNQFALDVDRVVGPITWSTLLRM